jgi:hypothetical protein
MLDAAAVTELTDARLVRPPQSRIDVIGERPAKPYRSPATVLVDRGRQRMADRKTLGRAFDLRVEVELGELTSASIVPNDPVLVSVKNACDAVLGRDVETTSINTTSHQPPLPNQMPETPAHYTEHQDRRVQAPSAASFYGSSGCSYVAWVLHGGVGIGRKGMEYWGNVMLSVATQKNAPIGGLALA